MNQWNAMPSIRQIHIQPGHTAPEDELLGDFVDKIKLQQTSLNYIVLRGKTPTGMIRSVDMFRMLGTLYGAALHYKKRLREVMHAHFLMVDWNMKVDEVSRKAMERSYEEIYDDIVVVNEDNEFAGVIPVYELLIFMTEYQVREAAQKNPLSGLPGNERIDEYLSERLREEQPFSIIYVDIDHFKSYNDVYGFKHGDGVLKWVGQLLAQTGIPELFVGHIGGDDYVVCLSQDSVASYCRFAISSFEEKKRDFYNAEDFERQYVQSLDRNHLPIQSPLICLSLAVLDISSGSVKSTSELAMMTARVKKQVKQMPGSRFVRLDTSSGPLAHEKSRP